MNRNPELGLAVERRLELLGEFAELSPRGFVEFPGGEVTLAFNELCRLAQTAERFALRAGVVTNGSTIRVPLVAKRLVCSGLERISVSLDSHRADVHDYVRGVDGAFAQATKALRLLVSARKNRMRHRLGPLIQVIAVVFDRNVHELAELIELCRSLGVDEVNFQLLNRTFANRRAGRDSFFERHFWHDANTKRQASAALRKLVDRYATDSILRTSPGDLERLERSIGSSAGESVQVCGAHRRNVIVDYSGAVSFCFNHPEGAPAPSVGDVTESKLRDVLASAEACRMRDLMSLCKKPCGQLECHRAH